MTYTYIHLDKIEQDKKIPKKAVRQSIRGFGGAAPATSRMNEITRGRGKEAGEPNVSDHLPTYLPTYLHT